GGRSAAAPPPVLEPLRSGAADAGVDAGRRVRARVRADLGSGRAAFGRRAAVVPDRGGWYRRDAADIRRRARAGSRGDEPALCLRRGARAVARVRRRRDESPRRDARPSRPLAAGRRAHRARVAGVRVHGLSGSWLSTISATKAEGQRVDRRVAPFQRSSSLKGTGLTNSLDPSGGTPLASMVLMRSNVPMDPAAGRVQRAPAAATTGEHFFC